MKYSVGQKVKIRSLEWYRDNVNRYGIIECGKYEFFEPMNEYCGKVVTIKRIDDDNYRIDADKGAFCWTDEMIEGLMEEETKPKKNISLTQEQINTMVHDSCVLFCKHCGCGIPRETCVSLGTCKNHDEYRTAIRTHLMEKKEKEYPKTYEECCEALEYIPHTDDIIGYKWDILQSLQKLLICRDAYWKIAGEEMGLDGPWEPDWNTSEPKYVIACTSNGIEKQWETTYCKGFAFPTEEMRDAFYENFKEEIEICKELL